MATNLIFYMHLNIKAFLTQPRSCVCNSKNAFFLNPINEASLARKAIKLAAFIIKQGLLFVPEFAHTQNYCMFHTYLNIFPTVSTLKGFSKNVSHCRVKFTTLSSAIFLKNPSQMFRKRFGETLGDILMNSKTQLHKVCKQTVSMAHIEQHHIAVYLDSGLLLSGPFFRANGCSCRQAKGKISQFNEQT